MEQMIRDVFERETMPRDCALRIEEVLAQPRKRRAAPLLRLCAGMAVLVLVVTLFTTTDLLQVCADVFDIPIHTQDPEETVPLGEISENVYGSYGGSIVEESTTADDNQLIVSASITAGADVPAEVRDGRLYFIANGENIDITDQCSTETAYLYIMQDQTGISHYIFVGGTPDNWGYGSIMYHPVKGDWIGGGGHNHCGPESNWEVYKWFRDAIAKIGCPFPI